MPVPSPNWTKSKWLIFFADLNSKIVHHNVSVVIEGCEILKRLLISRVSVGAFLEEGDLLIHLVNTCVSVVQCEKPPTNLDGEMLHALMQCLSLVVDMSMSLFADGDPYHMLLVLSRSTIFLDGLTNVLRGKNRHYFGFAARLTEILLSLPLTQVQEPLAVEDGVAARRHVQDLENNLKKLPACLQHMYDVVNGLVRTVRNPALGMCCRSLAANVASHLPAELLAGSPLNEFVAHQPGDEDADPWPQAVDLASVVHSTYESFNSARCHDDCLTALNDLWCCFVANGESTALLTGKKQAQTLDKFIKCSPKNSADEVLFRSILNWFAALVSSQPITVELQQTLLDTARHNLIPLLGASNSTKFVLEKPSTALCLLLFLQTLAPCCPPRNLEQWLGAGLLGHCERLVADAIDVRSVLVDAPSLVEGTLPDEVYLRCALTMCRTEGSTLAVCAMKLLCHVLQHHSRTMLESFPTEALALVQTMVPLCVRLVINNPTLQANSTVATNTSQGTLLHHYPKCIRACRPTAIGECAAITLDACFDISFDFTPDARRQLIKDMQSVSRATEKSVQPHLRATTSRSLLRLTTDCSQLVMLIKETPSVISLAVSAILKYDANAPQWEAAGSAELLSHILTVASEDSSVDENLHISHGALSLELLNTVGRSGVTYPSAAMLHLVSNIAMQQHRLTATKGVVFQSVLFPHNTSSVTGQWFSIIKLVINANFTLQRAVQKVTRISTVVKDALSRASAAFEELSVQFSYCAACFRGLYLLIHHSRTMSELLDPELMAHLFTSMLVVPPPAELATAIGGRFSVDISHNSLLQRTYEEMLVWGSHCMSTWFSLTGGQKLGSGAPLLLPKLTPDFSHGLCVVLSCDSISNPSRCALARALNTILTTLPGQQDIYSSLLPYANGIFVALLEMKESDVSRIVRSRCLALFASAVEISGTSGWLAGVVQEVHQLSCSLRVAKTLTTNEVDDLSGLMSEAVSALASAHCRPLPDQESAMMASALCTFLSFPKTRLLGLKALRSIAEGQEGRTLMLLEASEMDKYHRSAYAKLIHLVFDIPYVGTPAGERSRAILRDVDPMAGREAGDKLSAQELTLGTDAISTAAAKGKDVFALQLIKLKVVAKVEETLVGLDRQQKMAPTTTYRFLASVSFSGEVQCLIARRPALLTLLIEAAELNSVVGSLALLTIRNCCHYQACKSQLCQDTRITRMLSCVLACNPSKLADKVAVNEAYRKMELATSAMLCLVHGHQRGKTYIRAMLQETVAETGTGGNRKSIKLEDLLHRYVSNSKKGHTAGFHAHPAAAAQASSSMQHPRFSEVVDLPSVEKAIERNLFGLKGQGVVI